MKEGAMDKPVIEIEPYHAGPKDRPWWEWRASNGAVHVRGWCAGTKRDAKKHALRSLDAAETMERQRL